MIGVCRFANPQSMLCRVVPLRVIFHVMLTVLFSFPTLPDNVRLPL
jgi:hypothetical protein